jgi:redox-sensitive bicupin YhaK (pirin superfamily)
LPGGELSALVKNPIGQPPTAIVMNTQEQLRQAFEGLQQGTFLKSDAQG